MQDRLLSTAGAVARGALVIGAFVIAVSSIGLTIVRPFCPEGVPAPATDASVDPSVAPDADDGATTPPVDEGADGTDATDEDGTGDDSAGRSDERCASGASRCLPPMISGILELGDDVCHEQAASRMRGTLLPAMFFSTLMLGGAWALRPHNGGKVLSRW